MGLFTKKKKSVLELFDYNLREIDINTFEFVKTETNSVGTEFKKYEKILNEKEFDVFDKIDLLVFPTGEKNFIFSGSTNEINKSSLKKFIKNLISIYGKDNIGTGYLEEYEINSIFDEGFWIGRTWENKDVDISISVMEDELFEMTIHGL